MYVSVLVSVYHVDSSLDFLFVTGIILHFDNLDLSDYYFIDPHWLYDVFSQVCTPSVLTSNKISCE